MTMVSEQLRSAAEAQARKTLEEVAGVVAVVIATADGFDIASAVTRDIDPVRVAALASSISAIGSVVSQEARLGRSRSVTINTDAGFALLSAVNRKDVELVINIIANEHAILGQVAWRSGECVKALEAA
ncbi:roadblock/LC7 domain-containing protein [Polaromonas sp.]|uniref:roadblock/LC7 domain-containing protein n=1 Tax=Polaromonas sp. TaxID=1869339 RepID=UPI003264368D